MRRNARLRVASFSVKRFSAALRRPFITALGRKTRTENVAIVVQLSDGSAGYGEASSSLALRHLSAKNIAATLRSLGSAAIGREVSCPGDLIAEAWIKAEKISPAAAAFECALLEAVLSSRQISLSAWLGGASSSAFSDITISAWNAEDSLAAVQEARAQGFRALKIKLGGNLAEDLSRIKAAHRGAPPAALRLDANQAYGVSSTLRLLDACRKEKLSIELMEQPLAKGDYRGLARLRRVSPVPIAADESVSTPAEAARLISEECASIINIKLAKSGILRSLEIAAMAKAAGLDIMIGCMCETAYGLAASVHFALGTGFFRYVDLDSDLLLQERARPANWTRTGPEIRI